jgi:cellular nucleic acid-binding protein
MVYIYILKLQNNKYYVGKTTNPNFRLESHFNSNGSEWTKKYKPIKVLELIPNCDDYDEDKYTRIYMDRFGIESTRGGSFVKIFLDKATKEQLIKMSNSTNNKCFNCGKDGHYANECDYEESSDDEEYYKYNYYNKVICYRCGRDGHYASSCYATKHINGYYL